MLDQSFSVENFRKIFDYENRKGSYLEGRYFPEIEEVTKQLKTCVGKIKKLNVALPNYEELKLDLNSEKSILEDKKEKLLNTELEKICHIISRNDFSVNLIRVDTPTGKPIYKIDEFDVCSYFIIKQIQHNIKKLYKVQQSNRYNIICQLRSLLNDGFPKYIIRADIKEFYESISRERLLNKINKDGLLSLSSRMFIKVILNQYGKLSGSPAGIPRGIGISAYMAELYMRDFDHAIKNHHELIYYARYVDDIIAIYAPKPNSITEIFFRNFQDKIDQSKLNLNTDKTKKIDLTINKNGNFDYLGYGFCIKGDRIDISISKNKIKRYKKRLDIALTSYQEEAITNEKSAREILIKRIRFLTGNTRLSNNKDNALVGIYFSNSLICDSSSLKALDCYAKICFSKVTSEKLKDRLTRMSFEEGWKEKKYYNFSPKELKEIVKVWKNDN